MRGQGSNALLYYAEVVQRWFWQTQNYVQWAVCENQRASWGGGLSIIRKNEGEGSRHLYRPVQLARAFTVNDSLSTSRGHRRFPFPPPPRSVLGSAHLGRQSRFGYKLTITGGHS